MTMKSAGFPFLSLVFMLLLFLPLTILPGQEAEPAAGPRRFGVSFWPGINAPLQNGDVIDIGLAGMAGGEYRFSELPIFAGIDLLYGATPLEGYTDGGTTPFAGTISSISAFAKAGVRFPLTSWMTFSAMGFTGVGYNTLDVKTGEPAGGSEAAMGYGAAAGFEFPLSETLSLGLRGGYLAHLNTYGGLIVSAGTVISLPGRTARPRDTGTQIRTMPLETTGVPRGAPLVIDSVRFDTIFPVFYKYYDENPIGNAYLINTGNRGVSDITVRLNIPRFMDVVRTQEVPSTLDPGKSAAIDLSALLSDEVLRVTEGTKVAVKIDISFLEGGKEQSYSIDRVLDIADRNAMTWDDDRKAASFVTAKDPAVLTMARNVASVVRSSGFDAINLNVRTAVAMLEALQLSGISYVIDPSSPYAELSDQPQAVDFLQFPRQTLEYRAGDCDDLSILYAALMESVGIPAAFITVPGHIFAAVNTGMTPRQAEGLFNRIDELIVRDDAVWLPVEVTILNEGFLQAWQVGAKQWREHTVRDQAELFPIAEAWQLFPAAGLPDSPPRLDFPSAQALEPVYTSQLTRFIDREIFPQVSTLQSRIASAPGDSRHINRLGVLYARYGLIDRARAEFEKISRGARPHAPALLNMGNIHFLAREPDKALEYYQRALALSPDSTVALLAVARVNHELENYGLVARTYARLKQLDPDLAGRFGYLDFRGEEARRAAQVAEMLSMVVWDE